MDYKERIQPRKEWSEEDEKVLHAIRNALNYEKPRNYLKSRDFEFTDILDWLKSLKDRVLSQPKQEWSGGDEAHLHNLITHLEQWIERHPNTTGADIQGENVAWLRSLKLKLKD